MRIPLNLVLSAGWAVALLWAGCASKPAESTPQPSVGQTKSAAPSSPVAPPAAAAESKNPLPAAVTNAPAPFAGEGWESMFDGKTLTGWRETTFAGRGEIQCRSGVILCNMGDPFTGLNWTNQFPKMNYEIALDAMRVMGSDFFCGLTVPVGDSFCSMIVGGWGGTLVGISSVDHQDASENETTKFVSFETCRWYRIRLRITENRIESWIDDKKMADVVTTDRVISLRPGEIELSMPMGLACWQTSAAWREIKFRRVSGPADPVKERR